MKNHAVRAAQRVHDKILKASTMRFQAEPFFDETGNILKPAKLMLSDFSFRKLYRPQRCYICKEHYHEVHQFYHLLCPVCAEINFRHRNESTDLSGRKVLITGGRIKIGFETTLKLLRMGAEVMITTRFPADAATRYMKEPDSKDWLHRLKIHALDLRHIPSVEAFTDFLNAQKVSLDILINNAAQTIRKPESFYISRFTEEQKLLKNDTYPALISDFCDNQLIAQKQKLIASEEKKDCPSDEFGEPVDLRPDNSWTATLSEVETVELLETQVVNSIAPFILCSRLKSALLRSEHPERFILNVSAMEGQFNRRNKTMRHPHTNMAKAALNMITRTSAGDYIRDGIFMNSVDTGWVTDENPFPLRRKFRNRGTVPPLDCIDGASRILMPIVDHLKSGIRVHGKFLKDYAETEW